MKILVHWHPQLSHLIRSFVEPLSLQNISLKEIDLNIIVGANFLTGLRKPDHEFLEHFCSIFSEILSSVTLHYVPYEVQIFAAKRSNKNSCEFAKLLSSDVHASHLLELSIDDSLSRGLDNSFDQVRYFCDEKYASGLLSERREFAISLGNWYLELVKLIKPDLVSISHGNYDYYVCLYLSCVFTSTKIIIINGGHAHSYIPKSSIDVLDPGGCNATRDLLAPDSTGKRDHLIYLKNLVSQYRLQTDNSINEDNKSSVALALHSSFASHKSSLFTQQPRVLCFLPVYGELSHHNGLSPLSYSSKIAWTRDIFRKCSAESVDLAIRPHPHLAGYGQQDLSDSIVHHLSNEYSIKPTMLLDDESFYSYIMKYPHSFTFNGSIALELSLLDLDVLLQIIILQALYPARLSTILTTTLSLNQ